MTNSSVLNQKIEFLCGLNPEQHEAVTSYKGPMLIIAGAGTGKTHVITSRILHLLLTENVAPENILALTFTEKAAQEMLERVDKNLPLSYESIAIQTFHSFCDTLLREKGIEMGIDPSFKLLDQTQQWLFLKKHLFKLDLKYYRPLGNPNKFLFVLIKHFSRLKDEDISPNAYVKYAEKLQLETMNSVDEAAKEEAIKTLEIAKAYATYQELLMAENALDFGDLQYYALRLLQDHPSVLAAYQERFKYILVDEFQDTNFAQNKLVTLLAKKHQNLTVVGDDDQAIYKWRGASLSNILNFEETFPGPKKIVLKENYRSKQEILDLSYGVVQNNNPDRLEVREGIDKKLHANVGDSELGISEAENLASKPQIWHFPTYLMEAQKIVRKIQEGVETASLRYKDFAILFRANGQIAPFVDELKAANIPFRMRNSDGLLGYDEVKDMLAFLRFLRNPYDDIAFFRLLCLPLFDLPMREILDFVEKAKAAGHEPLFKFLKKFLKPAAIGDQVALPGLEETCSAGFAEMFDLFDNLLNFSKQQTVSRILGEFLQKSGYYNLFKIDVDKHGEQIRHLAQFLEIAQDFEMEGGDSKFTPVRSFLEYLELLEQAEGTIEPLQNEEEDAVSLLTFHSSKGLEFHTVFMPSLVAQRFPSIKKSDPVEIPQPLISEVLPEADQHLQEERRLFYVGCTRARERLILSYSDFYEGKKKWKPSIFLEESKATGMTNELDFTKESEVEIPMISADQTQKNLSQSVKTDCENVADKLAYLPEIKVSNLSYSQIDTFQNCPLKYKFRYLFKIPSPSAHAANFGSSVHNTLNEFYQLIQKGGKPSLEDLIQLFEKNWIPSGYESHSHEQARKKEGVEILQRYFEKECNPCKIPAYLEKAFRLKIGPFTFNGRIDRIDKLSDGTYEVIDYKTGSSKRDSNLKKDLQLSLYAIACKEIFKIPVSSLSLYFLEDCSKMSTERDISGLEEVKKELIKLGEELQSSKFVPTPGFACRFCEYKVLCNVAE